MCSRLARCPCCAAILVLTLLAGSPCLAQAPEIAYVTEPVQHWAPFLVFGEGFDDPQTELIVWAPPSPPDPEELVTRIVAQGLPTPPAEPPEGSLVGLYGRVRVLSPQVLGAVMQGAASVIWVRNSRGLSRPYVVNRPQLFFAEAQTVSPGQELRLFGRRMVANLYQPAPRLWLVARGSGRLHRLIWGVKYDHQGHLNYQLPYELRWQVPADLPEGEYDLWLYNGAGGEFGFGGPLALSVRSSRTLQKSRFDVTQYGAKANGEDDTAAIEQAIQAAAKAGGGAVYFPPGKYGLSRPLRVLPGVDLRGADRAWSHLIALPGFRGEFPREPLPGMAEDWGPHFRQVQAVPMVYLVSASTVSDLTLQGGEGVHWNVLIMRQGGTAEDLTVTRCRLLNPASPFLPEGKWADVPCGLVVLGPAERIEVSHCEISAMGGLGAIGGPLRHCRTLYNTYRPPVGPYGTTGMGWLIGDECLVEGNYCEFANRGFTCGPWFGPVRRNFIARNLIVNSGFVEGAGEAFLFEGPDVGRENFLGHPSRLGPDFLEQEEREWVPGQLAGRLVLVVHGKGFGQFRVIRDNTERRITLTEPWRILPDEDSWVAVRQFFFQNLLVNNYCRDTLGGIDFYGGALDNVVERFIGLRSRGVWFYAANVGDERQRMIYGPDAFNFVSNCYLVDARPGVYFEAARRLNLLQPMPLCFGNVVIGNHLVRCDIAFEDRVLQTEPYVHWLPPSDERRREAPPAFAFHAFGGNRFEPSAGQGCFRFDPWTFGSFLWLNSLATGGAASVEDKGRGTAELPRP